jgi:protoheme IX farnesyltransferase
LPHDQSLPADWRDLLALTKPRVMSLVVFTGLCGLLAAPGPVHPVLGFTAVLCIARRRSRRGVNQWYEADLDAKMKRTRQQAASGRADEPPDRPAFRG